VFEGILSKDVPTVWGRVAPILQRAIDLSQGDYLAKDVYHALKAKDMQLWVWREGQEISTVWITQILNYPQRKVCQLLFVAGSGLRQKLATEETFVQWAKAQGCTQCELGGRDGWLRVLAPRNWFKVWTTMRKDI
jgi:hypothetical protein